jgi:hypothetical protein
VAGEALHDVLDTGNVPLDLFQVQPPSDNLIVRGKIFYSANPPTGARLAIQLAAA